MSHLAKKGEKKRVFCSFVDSHTAKSVTLPAYGNLKMQSLNGS